ncbi:MAG TPA: SCO family protein [Alphaproteobacteria bacterium]|nr:hypothetical protein [Rhodospirillaceae bacterium]HRJ12959.1 SCO family protein [Alphaproteobacteria bacterium]
MSKNPTTIIIIVAIILAAVIGFMMIAPSQPEQTMVEETITPPDGGIETGGIELGAAPYALSGTNGEMITEKSFPDKYKLFYFGFTRCPDVCPVGMGNITAAMTALGADADKVQPIFITVDPAYDTLQIVQEYLAAFDKHFVGATGTAEQIKAAQDSFRVYASQAEPPAAVEATTPEQTQPAPPATEHTHDAHADHAAVSTGMINHSDYIYLMDKSGKLLNVFPGNTDGQTLASNMQTVLAAEMIPPADGMPTAPVETAVPVPDAIPATPEAAPAPAE